MGLKAGIYVRVSTEEQRDYGYSIDGQIRELKDYCERKNYDVVDIYNDAGFSGKNMNRPNLERLLNDIKKGLINVIVAIKVDRLTRDGYDGQWLLKECNKYDVTLDLLYEHYDVNTVNGEMMYGLNLLFAQRERKEIGNRTKRGLEEAVRQGKYPTKVPFGYQRDIDGKLLIDPVASVVVKDIFELYASGMSMNAISNKFNKEKRLNYKNDKWRDDKICKIISNPIYKGEIHWRRTTSKSRTNPVIIIPNHSPKIVSEELYDKCMKQLQKNKHGGYGQHTHIFQYIVKCPYCDKMMSNYFTVRKRAHSSKEFYYVTCHNPTCEGKNKIYNTEKIENALIKILNAIALDYKSDKYSIVLPYQEKNTELDGINKALEKLKKDEQKLIDLYLKSSINIEVINKKSEGIQKEISNLEIRKQKLEETENTDTLSLSQIFEKKEKNVHQDINNFWKTVSREDRKRIISKYIKRIEINVYDNYQIAISKVVFQDEFIKDGINNFTKLSNNCVIKSTENALLNSSTFKEINDDESSISLLNLKNRDFNEAFTLLKNRITNQPIC